MEARLASPSQCLRPGQSTRDPRLMRRRTPYDRRRSFRRLCLTAARLAKPALDRSPRTALDTADLLAADHPGQRCSDHDPPVDGPCVYRAGFVARTRRHRPDAGPTPHDVAGGYDPIHALVRYRLERGHQWRLPRGRLILNDVAHGD